MKTEEESLIESLVDLYKEMNQQKEMSQMILQTGEYVTKFNQYLALAKKKYPDNSAIKSLPETQPMKATGIAQLPELTSEAPPKFADVKLKVKQILNALNVDPNAPIPSHPIKASALQTVSQICDRFDLVAKQLLLRHGNRNTLTITDEYDVQDLLHCLLRLFFNDVRSEEYTPSYAGGSSRMDFLLKEEKTVIESKYDLPTKDAADQVAIDITKYRAHPDCKTLVCFVYDPKSRIENPRGLENDLAKASTSELKVSVIVRR